MLYILWHISCQESVNFLALNRRPKADQTMQAEGCHDDFQLKITSEQCRAHLAKTGLGCTTIAEEDRGREVYWSTF